MASRSLKRSSPISLTSCKENPIIKNTSPVKITRDVFFVFVSVGMEQMKYMPAFSSDFNGSWLIFRFSFYIT